MKFSKKITPLLIFVLLLLIASSVLFACDENNTTIDQDSTENTTTNSAENTTANAEANKHEHQWVEATCTYSKTCRLCNETEGEALGHTEVVDNAISPTCTTKGLTEGKHCSICTEIITKQIDIPELGHDWGNPTCTTPRSCCVCFEVDPKSQPLGHSYIQGICETCGDIDVKLQQMSALGIDTAYNSAKFPSTLRLSLVTYEDMINGYGDSITRMVMRCYATNSFGGYGDIYVVILCCEYETDYLDFEWDGLYFSTSAYSDSPGICEYLLDNEDAMNAYKNLIINPKEIPYD